jgi:NAD(P)-dependent dehydrogenase (short-subunit alcohol dehydrogenase family)
MDDGLPLVGVIGAGTMGAGIAQVAAIAGHRVLLADAVDGAAGRAIDRIRERVKALAAKGRLAADADALDITPAQISPSSAPGLADAGVVIEAVVEDLEVKRALFAQLEAVVSADCLLASNSSSLTPTAMAAGLAHPERLVGLHFFNPVPAMKLVEVISGLATAASAAVAGPAEPGRGRLARPQDRPRLLRLRRRRHPAGARAGPAAVGPRVRDQPGRLGLGAVAGPVRRVGAGTRGGTGRRPRRP